MKILAQKGINIFCTNLKNINVLHLAVSKGHLSIVQMLLQSQFPLDLETSDGMTAFQLAAFHGREQIMAYIIEFIKQKDDPEFKDYILNKVNPKSDISTLAYSILNQHDPISVMLVEFGAKSYYDETNE